MYTDFTSAVDEEHQAENEDEEANMYLPIKSYTTANDYELLTEEGEQASSSDDEDTNSMYVILAEDASSKSANSKRKPQAVANPEEDPTKLIEEADPHFLKETLIAHSKDHRVHMLSYLIESIQQHKKKETSHEAGERHGDKEETSKRRTNLREWNQEMQNVLGAGLGAKTSSTGVLHELGHDFVNIAETYAKIIINEVALPNKEKTIKPVDIGGVAGGDKYIIQGILFKFCRDKQIAAKPQPLWMYGGGKCSDEYAMKAGGLEMQGLESWITKLHPQLLFPLMAMIDYKGFRVVATSLLPVDKKTLCYGSHDGGQHVLASDPALNEIMASCGDRNNLKKHRVGNVYLHTPGDIEGHKGHDGNYYLLDFARTMPPEAPTAVPSGRSPVPRGIFYRMLRPELVFSNPAWGLKDDNLLESHKEVEAATKRIFTDCIPQLAAKLLSIESGKCACALLSEKQETLKEFMKPLKRLNIPLRMHLAGINLRHMGFLRTQLPAEARNMRAIILALAVARTVKQLLRYRLRTVISKSRLSEATCKRLVADFFNEVLFDQPVKSDENTLLVWPKLDLQAEVERKFPTILSEEEREEPTCTFMKKRVDRRLVMAECLHLQLVRLSPQACAQLCAARDLSAFTLTDVDIVEVCATVRYVHYLLITDAMVYQRKARKIVGFSTLIAHDLLRMSIERAHQLKELKEDLPCKYENRLAEVKKERWDLYKETLAKAMAPEAGEGSPRDLPNRPHAKRLLHEAANAIEKAEMSWGLCPMTSLVYADVWCDFSRLQTKWEKIEMNFEMAYKRLERAKLLGGDFPMLYEEWGNILSEHARLALKHAKEDLAKKLIAQAEQMFEKSVEHVTAGLWGFCFRTGTVMI